MLQEFLHGLASLQCNQSVLVPSDSAHSWPTASKTCHACPATVLALSSGLAPPLVDWLWFFGFPENVRFFGGQRFHHPVLVLGRTCLQLMFVAAWRLTSFTCLLQIVQVWRSTSHSDKVPELQEKRLPVTFVESSQVSHMNFCVELQRGHTVDVGIFLMHERATMPRKGTPQATAYDIFAPDDIILPPSNGETCQD